MDGLLDLLDDVDRLHADHKLDIRHRERFNRYLERWWPRIIDGMRRRLESEEDTVISHIGTLDHCRKILDAYLDDFRLSNHGGLTVRLDRSQRAAATPTGSTSRPARPGQHPDIAFVAPLWQSPPQSAA